MNMAIILPLFLGNARGWQLIVIAIVILLLFGGKKIPELMKGLGKGVHAFKQGMEEAKREINKPVVLDDDKTENASEKADKKPVQTAAAKDTEE